MKTTHSDTMRHYAFLLSTALLAALPVRHSATAQGAPAADTAKVAQYVNPLIGTGRIEGALRGCNYPGATVPFGMVQLSPDTREAPSWDCTSGYAYEAGLPYVSGLIKNRYIGRTYIQPSQKQRDTAVKLKLNPVKSVVSGKSVIVVDDSIVRGTTSGKIVKMLRDAGAREVHMIISSPPIGFPCFYGIVTSVRKELIAATKSVEEIREYIGADSLYFLSLEALKKCVPQLNPKNLCVACFNGGYPIEQKSQSPAEADKYIFETRKKKSNYSNFPHV